MSATATLDNVEDAFTLDVQIITDVPLVTRSPRVATAPTTAATPRAPPRVSPEACEIRCSAVQQGPGGNFGPCFPTRSLYGPEE